MERYREPTPVEIKEQRLYLELGLTESEYERAVELLGRLPNYTETGMFGALWSEHCSYKNSKQVLKRFPTTGEQVLMGPGEGAGVVDIGGGLGIAFKMESHNSPSAVEPFMGAATGVGGILRDVYSMGARPIAILNSVRFGELADPRVRHLFKEAVRGMAWYGNETGVPGVGGEVYFDERYRTNPLVNAMCIGLVAHDRVCRGTAKGAGNPVLYVGADTGRDGIAGATFSSAELREDETPEHAVAIGDAAAGKALMEACLEMIELPGLIGIQDMGAAGLTSSSAEMAEKGGSGIELNLDLVPQREAGMTPFEMMLSESQERMLLVVEKEQEDQFAAICEKYGLKCAVIGRVTDDHMLRLLFNGETAAEVPVAALTGKAPVYQRKGREPETYRANQTVEVKDIPVTDVTDTLKRLLASPSIASKEWIYSQFDYNAGGTAVAAPGSDAAVVGIPGTSKAVAAACDCNARYVELDPQVGGAIAVAEAARNLVCVGAKPLAVTDNLNFGSPENPEVFWQLEQAVEGISAACRELNTPVVSGNVSLYNETNGRPIYPTPVIGMVGLLEDIEQILANKFQKADDVIVLLGRSQAELGGSQLQKLVEGTLAGRPPALDLDYEKRLQQAVLMANQKKLLSSAHDVSDGGLAVAVLESAFGTGLGIDLDFTQELSVSAALFGESQSRIVVSVDPEKLSELAALVSEFKLDYTVLGKVTGQNQARIVYNQAELVNCSLKELEAVWKDGIACLMTD